MINQTQIFKHLKVVEFASVLAGPAVGMFFAELGAEVVKIENAKTKGDMTRNWKLPSEDKNSPISAYYCSINWGKETVLLDLSSKNDQKRAFDYMLEADILLSNFNPAAAKSFGLDERTCRAANPKLIYALLTAYPDPEDPRPAFDMVMQAETGFLYMCGEPNRPPVKMPVALIDILAAHQLKEAILLALFQRSQNGGKGAFVSVSLMEAALASLANQATNWLMAGVVPQPIGSQHPNIAPYGDFFACADGNQIVLAVGTEKQWAALCALLGMPDLAEKPEFAHNSNRLKHRNALNALLKAAFLEKKRDAWLAAFAQHRVPAAPIRRMDEVFALPEAQAMVLEEIGEGGRQTKRVKTVAFSMDWNTD